MATDGKVSRTAAPPAPPPAGCALARPPSRPRRRRPFLTAASPSSLAPQSGVADHVTVFYAPRGTPPANTVLTSNRVITSKYNILTFLPLFLYQMFSRVAYLYFLLQARLVLLCRDVLCCSAGAAGRHGQGLPAARRRCVSGRLAARPTCLPPLVHLTCSAGGPVVVERRVTVQRCGQYRRAAVCAGGRGHQGDLGGCQEAAGGQAHEHQRHAPPQHRRCVPLPPCPLSSPPGAAPAWCNAPPRMAAWRSCGRLAAWRGWRRLPSGRLSRGRPPPASPHWRRQRV
jgi:hypothetical protein